MENRMTEHWLTCVKNDPYMLMKCPKEYITEEMCMEAMRIPSGERGVICCKSGLFVKMPRQFRNEEACITALTRRDFGHSVAYVLRNTPAAAKTDRVLEVAYQELLKERSADWMSPLSVSNTAGKVTDKAFAAFIKQKEASPEKATKERIAVDDDSAGGSVESPTVDFLMRLYRRLFELNIEGAEEDYLAGYIGMYGPENALHAGMTESEVREALLGLLSELYNDTGSDDAVREWFLEAGGSERLYQQFI